MGLLINRAKAQCSVAGAGAVTLGSAVAPFRSWSGSGATAGYWYDYLIEQGSAWEMGVGFYNGTTLTRPGPGVDPWFDSSTGSLLTVTGADTIACVANRYTIAAGGPFMPPMSSYFPTSVSSGTTGITLQNTASGGLEYFPSASPVTGDKTQSKHKTITAAGDWSSVARFSWTQPFNTAAGNYYAGHYVRRSGGRMVVFGPNVDGPSKLASWIVFQLQQDGSGWLAATLATTTFFGSLNSWWSQINYTSSTSTLTWSVASDAAGVNYNQLGSWTTSTLNMGGAPNTLGLGFTTNKADFWPILSCPYWWDNA